MGACTLLTGPEKLDVGVLALLLKECISSQGTRGCHPQPASPGGPGAAALGTVNAEKEKKKRLRDPSFSTPVPLWATLNNEGIDTEPQSERVQAPET